MMKNYSTSSLNQCIKQLLQNCSKVQIVVMESTRGRYKPNNPEELFELDMITPGGYNLAQGIWAYLKIYLYGTILKESIRFRANKKSGLI